ncbi:LCP family protein [Ornithinimicrobium cerasi]|uniref:LCP family protein n=1 Tax=Ornithinimicrobium cerasi TaxID=2248773 RepID=UPI000EFE0EEA|nr:LCP family protein [Ornithinimicrobium cerasi]
MGYEDRPSGSADVPGGTRRERRRRRPLRAMAQVVGVLALVGILVVAGYAFFLQRTVADNITHEELRADDDDVITISPDLTGGNRPGQDDAGETGEAPGDTGAEGDDGAGDGEEEDGPVAPIVAEDGTVIDVEGLEVVATSPERTPTAGDALNFLIIGTDSRDLGVERGRSDVIVLMHISDDRDRVDLVHFPRDLFVPIAGTGGSSKINAAYSYGGAPLLVQTLQPLVDVPIDHVVIVNFESFRAMTDAIGGVDVTVTEGGGGFSTGVQHMNGDEGLRFVRERYSLSQGDISRGERQMQFVKAVMLKALSRETLTNPARLASFVDAATTNLTVDEDLRVGDMRDLGFSMRNVRGGDISFWQGPWCGISDHPVAGSIVLMSQSQMGRLSEALRTDSMGSYVDNVSPTSGFSGVCG